MLAPTWPDIRPGGRVVKAHAFETLRPVAVPQGLALGLAVGRAAEALELARYAQSLTNEDRSSVETAATMLRPTDAKPPTTRLADQVRRAELLDAAASAFPSSTPTETLQQLQDVADRLGRLATANHYDDEGVPELVDQLLAIRGALLAANGEPTDDFHG